MAEQAFHETSTHTARTDSDVFDETVDYVIVGAGFAGLAMGSKLLRNGKTSFVIVERAAEVGGTWRDNTYPGAACDVPSHLYSFSFAMNANWSSFYSPGPEIQEYLLKAARDEGLYPYMRFNANMEHARWDAERQRWDVHTPRGTYTGRYLITGTGHLADPKLPSIPGLDSFTGDIAHSARWTNDLDLTGQRVAVVGTGASAIQLVPQLAEVARELVVFQRTPAWVGPRIEKYYSPSTQRMFERSPETMQRERDDIFWFAESGYAARRGAPAALEATKKLARDHISAAIDDPNLVEQLTPTYAPGCKRLLTSNTYYPAFTKPHVSLEASALARVEDNTLYGASGRAYEVDAIAFCTGFETVQPPFADNIADADGRTLAEHWNSGMAAFDSTAVAGFPNLFAINGPNTSLGHNSIVYIIESQTQYVLEALERAEREQIAVMVPSAMAQEAYVDKLQERAATTVWLRDGGCDSWYVDPRSGKLTLIWPDYAYDFRARNGHFTGDDFLSIGAGGEEVPLEPHRAETTA